MAESIIKHAYIIKRKGYDNITTNSSGQVTSSQLDLPSNAIIVGTKCMTNDAYILLPYSSRTANGLLVKKNDMTSVSDITLSFYVFYIANTGVV